MKRFFLLVTFFALSFTFFRVVLRPQPLSPARLQEAKELFEAKATNDSDKKNGHHSVVGQGRLKLLAIRNLADTSESQPFLVRLLEHPNPMVRREALLKLKNFLPSLPEAKRLEILAKAGPQTIQLATLSDAELLQVFYAR